MAPLVRQARSELVVVQGDERPRGHQDLWAAHAHGRQQNVTAADDPAPSRSAEGAGDDALQPAAQPPSAREHRSQRGGDRQRGNERRGVADVVPVDVPGQHVVQAPARDGCEDVRRREEEQQPQRNQGSDQRA
jgi:hypothetical protein